MKKCKDVYKNVARDTILPLLKPSSIMTLTPEQVQRLAEVAKVVGPMEYMAILIAIGTGVRLGELFGLKWDCIDLEKGVISIKRVLITSHGQRGDFQESKPQRYRRQIPLPEDVTQELRKYKNWQEIQKQLLDDKWQENNLVLATTFGQTVEASDFISRRFKKILKEAGIPCNVKFHDLRNTYATLLLHEGIHPRIVQERLGHSSISITLNIYSHIIENMQNTATKVHEGMIITTKESGKDSLLGLAITPSSFSYEYQVERTESANIDIKNTNEKGGK